MGLDSLARLRNILQSFPSDWAYGRPEPSSHRYDWAGVEQAIGVSGLPADYKRLMEDYGRLVIAGIFISDPNDFAAAHEMLAEDLREHWTEYSEESRPVHPQPGGLLLCASTEGRDALWWDTSQPNPDRWTITWDVEFDRHTFDGTLTELLVAELTGQLEPRLTDFTVPG
jgi:hypothetical protein